MSNTEKLAAAREVEQRVYRNLRDALSYAKLAASLVEEAHADVKRTNGSLGVIVGEFICQEAHEGPSCIAAVKVAGRVFNLPIIQQIERLLDASLPGKQERSR
jgi:hypothetical protein